MLRWLCVCETELNLVVFLGDSQARSSSSALQPSIPFPQNGPLFLPATNAGFVLGRPPPSPFSHHRRSPSVKLPASPNPTFSVLPSAHDHHVLSRTHVSSHDLPPPPYQQEHKPLQRDC